MNPDDEPCGAREFNPVMPCVCDRAPGHKGPHRCACQHTWPEKPKAA